MANPVPLSAELSSIGLDSTGRTVVRLRFSDQSVFHVEIGTVSFAQLAAKGVRVYNDPMSRLRQS